MGHRPKRLDGSYGVMIAGPGVPPGGTPTQYLMKNGFEDYNSVWANIHIEHVVGLTEALDQKVTEAELIAIAQGIGEKVDRDGDVMTGSLTVPGEAYGVNWNDNLTVPTKNDIYDQVQLVETNLNANYVLKAGDTMTGKLTNLDRIEAAQGVKTAEGFIAKGFPFHATDLGNQVEMGWLDSTFGGFIRGVERKTSVSSFDKPMNVWGSKVGLGTVGTDIFTVQAGAVTSFAPLEVPHVSYGPAWDGDFTVPTKDAIYDLSAGFATDAELAAGLATKAPVMHTHIIGDVTGLQAALDGKQPAGSYASTAIFTSGAAGLVPASGGGTTNFLRADGTFAAPPGGGGGGLTDGDKGDVVVSGGGAGLTVESATPASGVFEVTGSAWLSDPSGTSLGVEAGTVIVEVGVSSGGLATFGTSSAHDFTIQRSGSPLITLKAAAVEINSVPLKVIDEAYGASWDGKLEVPTKNALYDKIQTLGSGGGAVDDTTYGPSWDGVTTIAPSKNAVYDKVQALAATIPADPTAAISAKVAKAGDTMTGNLTLGGTGDANRKVAWSGAGANIYMNSGGAAAYGATDHNWTDIAGTGIFGSLSSAGLYANGNLNITGNAHILGKNVGTATDNSLLLRNTLTYNTISMVSYATDGSAGSTDGYIQSVRAGPMAISGATGLEFRIFNTAQMWMNSFGLVVSGAVHAKATVPTTNGWAGITCGNTTNSGYLEVYGPNQARAAYIGYADTSAVYIVAETSRSMVTTAAGFGWRRSSDNLEIMSLTASGAFETYTIIGKGSTGTFAGSNIVQSLEARAGAASQGAWMAFHQPGVAAMHIGLDVDNEFKIGGWGWGYTKPALRLDSNGILTLAGNALQLINSSQCEIRCGDPSSSHGIMYMSNVNAGFYKGGGNHFYVEMAAGGTMHHSGPMRSDGKMVFRNSNAAFASAEIFIGASAPSGGNDGDVWLQYV